MMKRLLQKRLQGGITTYALILFGMSLVLYMFGFTNMMGGALIGASNSTGYIDTATTNGTNGSITDPNFQQNSNPVSLIGQAIVNMAVNNPWIAFGGLGMVVMGVLAGIFFGKETTATFFQYIIPIGIIAVVLNYFIFPIYTLDQNLRNWSINGLGISTILIIFFNLVLILAFVDYIIGRQT
jgi:hypothetical protein